MAATQAHGHLDFLPGSIEMPSGGHNYSVLPDDEGSINGREFLHGILELRVKDVSLLFGIALEGIDDHLVGELEDLLVVAQYENRAHGLSLPALGGKLKGDVQHSIEHLRLDDIGDDGKVCCGQYLELLSYLQDNEGVENPELWRFPTGTRVYPPPE